VGKGFRVVSIGLLAGLRNQSYRLRVQRLDLVFYSYDPREFFMDIESDDIIE